MLSLLRKETQGARVRGNKGLGICWANKEAKVINEEVKLVLLVGSENPKSFETRKAPMPQSKSLRSISKEAGKVIIVSSELKAKTFKEIRKLLIPTTTTTTPAETKGIGKKQI